MATAAFKSTTRRQNSENTYPRNKSPAKRRTQRSLSVSAVSRAHSDIDSDFLNKRDNPLFSSTTSQAHDSEFDDKLTRKPELQSGSVVDDNLNSVCNDGRRGRSVSRNVDSRGKKTVGRSLSRGPSLYGASESEMEQESVASKCYGGINNSKSAMNSVRRSNSIRRGAYESEVDRDSARQSNYQNTKKSNIASIDRQNTNLARNRGGTLQRTKSFQSVPSLHSVTVAADDYTTNLRIPNWDDEMSTGSVSEAEEKTIKAVCEQMKGNDIGSVTSTSEIYETVRSEVRRAISDIQNDLENSIRQSSATRIATADVTSIAPDLVKPGAVELVLDIRREYARKLEESQERARKLRSDLAVEEHRGEEFSRILKETLPDPKVSTIQRSYPGRRTSSERKRMSKRLTEEAMSYFDECVSISTFDSSDFSAAEDTSVNSVRATRLVGCSSSLPEETSCIVATSGLIDCQNDKKETVGDGQSMHSPKNSGLTGSAVDAGNDNAGSGRKSQFSLAREPASTTSLQQEINSYIQNNAVILDKDDLDVKMTHYNSFNIEDYHLQGHAEELLFDRVSFKNRIESGSLHLCTAGIGISFSPFASVL